MTTSGTVPTPERLTSRQREVLELLRCGYTNEEIAERLGISLGGVKWHVSEIIGRLGVSDRYEAARWRADGDRRPWWALAWLRELRWGTAAKVASAAVVGVVIIAVVALGWGVWRTSGSDRNVAPGPRTLIVATEGGGAIAVDTETGGVAPRFGKLKHMAHVISPDGTRAAFPCGDDGQILDTRYRALCVWDSAALRPTVVASSSELTPGGFLMDESLSPLMAWSADGSKVAFLVYQRTASDIFSSGDLYMKDLDSGELRLLDRGEFARFRHDLRWSPDGAHVSMIDVAASSIHSDEDQSVLYADLRLIDVASGQRTDVNGSLGTRRLVSSYAWSPDSRALAFTGQGSLYVVDITAAAISPQRIGDADHDAPDWSPDGAWIAGSELVNDRSHVFVTRADGSERRRVDGGMTSSSDPAWSPDSRYIAFAGALAPDTSDDPQLYVAGTSGGAPREVAGASPLASHQMIIAWSPDGERVLYTADSGECDGGRRFLDGGFAACPPGHLFMVSADGSSTPRKLHGQPASEILGWDE